MNWFSPRSVLLALILFLITSCTAMEELIEGEKGIPLSEVPTLALEAARAAVAGITLTVAEIAQEGERVIYELEGRANGHDYEIEVTAEGEVLEVEQSR